MTTNLFLPEDNTLYYHIDTLGARIARNFPEIHYSDDDLIEEVGLALESIKCYYSMHEYKNFQVEVKEGKASAPCNMYRLLMVKNKPNGCSVKYEFDGKYFNLGNYNGYVYIDFTGIPMSEDGLPMIEKSTFEYCYYYFIKNKLMQKFINGLMNGNAWQVIQQGLDNGYWIAHNSNKKFSRDKFNKMQSVVMNMKRITRLPQNM